MPVEQSSLHTTLDQNILQQDKENIHKSQYRVHRKNLQDTEIVKPLYFSELNAMLAMSSNEKYIGTLVDILSDEENIQCSVYEGDAYAQFEFNLQNFLHNTHSKQLFKSRLAKSSKIP